MVSAPVLLAALAVAAAPAAGGSAVAGCRPGPGTQLAATASYRFALHVGMAEQMYTAAQVRTMHPKHGEVMLRGSMAMGGMSMAGSMRHLEVQICARKDAVIVNAHPSIAVDDTSMNMTTKVPVAVMEGIGEGAADLHYGNNIPMRSGHRFTITVALRGERAVFHLRLP